MKYKVYNRCKYAVGVRFMNGLEVTIRPGSFYIMTEDDIQFIESICRHDKLFAQKMLVPVDETGKDVPIEKIGIWVTEDAPVHMNDEEIAAMLKQSVKKMETWLDEITDPVELHAIYKVAVTLDLPASKLKLLNDRIPNKDWLDTNG